MSEAAWLPGLTDGMLAIAYIAIAGALYVIRRRAPLAPAASWTLAAGIFLVASAAMHLLEAAGVGGSVAALRVITSVAGVATAVLLFASSRASASTTRTALPVATPEAATLPPIPASTPSAPPRPRADDEPATDSPPVEAGFLGLVSHELRTPLTAMQLLLDRLNDSATELPPRQRKIVDRLNGTTTRLTDLVDSILYYARLQSGRLFASVEPFDLAALASTVADECRAQAERKGLALDTTGAGESVMVESDPKLLRLVIVNLVSNAVKFTEQGQVTVSVEASGTARIVRVGDSGSGIPVAEQQRIFEPFQNVEARKHKHLPGVGLGLSLARQIVDNLGGEIAVRSAPGEGSTFEVSLPAVARPRTAPT